jgi:hypothetical protein
MPGPGGWPVFRARPFRPYFSHHLPALPWMAANSILGHGSGQRTGARSSRQSGPMIGLSPEGNFGGARQLFVLLLSRVAPVAQGSAWDDRPGRATAVN